MIPINSQAIEKSIQHGKGVFLSVHSIFYTIQGEGPYTGCPAVFIRLAGCNLQCPGCDTDYTNGRNTQTYMQIVQKVIELQPVRVRSTLVVITGGEPFRQNIQPLVDLLIDEDYSVQIETNGTLPPPEGFHPGATIVCSPKAGRINKQLMPKIDAFKYVMSYDSVDPTDGLPILALNHTASPRVARPDSVFIRDGVHLGYGVTIYLQPMDAGDESTNKLNLDACIASCKKFGYTLQLQIHKIIGAE